MTEKHLDISEFKEYGLGDFDPEDLLLEHTTSESEHGERNTDFGRGHYGNSEKSRIRLLQPKIMPPRYSGNEVSRDLLEEDGSDNLEDSDSGDTERRLSRSTNTSSDAVTQNENEEIEQFNHANTGANRNNDADRAALQAIARRAESSAVQGLQAAARADVDKGIAVRKQRTAFNALLDLRIRLQKGVVAANSINAISESEILSSENIDMLMTAESAALRLLSTINNLRHSFRSRPDRTGNKKRHFSEISESPLGSWYADIASTEIDLSQPRRMNLDTWAKKTDSVNARLRANRLRAEPNPQSLADFLEVQLKVSSMTRLVARTRIARSCAPLQAAAGTQSGSEIYDDADWYSQLLRELVESKLASHDNANVNPRPHVNLNTVQLMQMQRDAKTRRSDVDVRASKGRRLRFTVQEKIQNYVAPDDRTTWGELQTKDLFNSLLGRRKNTKTHIIDMDDEQLNATNAEGNQPGMLPLFNTSDKDVAR